MKGSEGRSRTQPRGANGEALDTWSRDDLVEIVNLNRLQPVYADCHPPPTSSAVHSITVSNYHHMRTYSMSSTRWGDIVKRIQRLCSRVLWDKTVTWTSSFDQVTLRGSSQQS